MAKKRAGFFLRALVLKAPEFQYTFWQLFFMNDEELLMYYEATQKLLETKIKDENHPKW